MKDAITAMRWALVASSSGFAFVPPRLHFELPDRSGIGLVMPAFVHLSQSGVSECAYAIKAFTAVPSNHARGLPAFEGATLMLDPETSRCLAVIDAGALTAIRTAACAGVATDLLARADSTTLAVVGAGPQGRALVEAMCLVRRIDTIRIYDSRPLRAVGLCNDLQDKEKSITCAGSSREAVRGADIICTATSSTEPLFLPDDIQVGTHINAIGSFRPEMREIPGQTMLHSRLFADSAVSALNESGDLLKPITEGLFTADHLIGEIGHLLVGKLKGRENPLQVTLYKSVGNACQDAVAGFTAYQIATTSGIGQVVDW